MLRTFLLASISFVAACSFAGPAGNKAQRPEKIMTDGAQPGVWTMDLEAARKVADEKGKAVFLNFTGSDWCGWCMHMEAKVFSQDAWKTYAKENLVPVWLDLPKNTDYLPDGVHERNQKLAEEYGVQGMPTYFVEDPEGTVLGQLGASRDVSPEAFTAKLDRMLWFSEGHAKGFAEKLPQAQGQKYLQHVQQYQKVREELQAWMGEQPPRNPENMEKFNAFRQRLAQAEQAVASIRHDYKASQLPADTAAQYKKLQQELKQAREKLDDFLDSDPNPEQQANVQKFQTLQQKVSELRAELAKY